MKTLHSALEEAFERQLDFATIATRAIAKKAADQGVHLSQRELVVIRKRLQQADNPEVVIRRWRFWQKRSVKISLNEDDIRGALGNWERLMERLPEVLGTIADDSAVRILDKLKGGWAREQRQQAKERAGFEQRLQLLWGEPLSLLEMLNTIATEAGETVATVWHEAPDPANLHTAHALFRLHARARQIACEIHALLRHGFADGALARWRTMHELTVTSLFLVNHGDSVAERYLLHTAVESWRAAQDYQVYCQSIGYPPFSVSEMDKMRTEFEALVSRFGPSYGTQYGWAAEIVGKKQPTFRDIEKAAALDHLRPYYRMAGQSVPERVNDFETPTVCIY